MFLFKNKEKTDPYALVEEKWITSFGFLQKKRFAIQQYKTYESGIDKNRFFLRLKKKNLFAWVLSELYRYDDFCLEADLEFEENSPHSAAGFLLRYINDENFYYFLVSNKGSFRFDVVFNGNPMVRIDWTESPFITDRENSIRIIARDTHFSFYIDDEWVAEVNDDTLFEGRIGFAAQNYEEKNDAFIYMNRFSIESRPIEVEKHYERWNNYIPQDPEARLRLANTFYMMSAFPAAAIQMKKALRTKKPDSKDYFLFGEMCINMNMYDTALESIERCLEIDQSHKEAIIEKGNILYLLNRFIDARDYIKENISKFDDNAAFWNLLGNCEYSLGNWEKSLEAYEKACSIQDNMPLFYINAARTAAMKGDKEKGLDYYLKASRLLFRQEAYIDLYPVFSQVQKLDPQNKEVRALEGKILFQEKKYTAAEKIFKKLILEGYEDSSIYYLYGIISLDNGDKARALENLSKACELEDSFYLFWLKLGEIKLISGQNPEMELKKALDLAPENPWVLNQYGLFFLDKKEFESAKDYFQQAYEKLPAEADIAINVSQTLYRLDHKDKAFAMLETEAFLDNPKIHNHKGNLFTYEKEYDKAIIEYEKALKIEPENPIYLENCAKACMEVDRIMQAEEYLTNLFDISPSASVCNLIGYLALIKREWVRAGIAFKEGLEKDPDNYEIMLNLASLYLDRSDYKNAKEWSELALKKNPENEDILHIQRRIREKFEIKYECSACHREWWVPRNIPAQSQLKLHGEPPGDAPAGECEKCGKIYCVECGQKHLKDKRFVCPDCDQFLKLSADWLKYVLLGCIKHAEKEAEKEN